MGWGELRSVRQYLYSRGFGGGGSDPPVAWPRVESFRGVQRSLGGSWGRGFRGSEGGDYYGVQRVEGVQGVRGSRGGRLRSA